MSTRTLTFSGADLRTKALAVDDDKLVVDATGNVQVGTSNLFVDTQTGRVGVGTTAPTESLDIVGNLNLQKVSNTASIKLNSNVVTEFVRSKKLIKYPRVAMTQNDESSTTGYVASASRENTSTQAAYAAFNNVRSDFWSPDGLGYYYNGTDYAFNPSASNSSLGGIAGEWIKLRLPEDMTLHEIRLCPRQGGTYPQSQFFEDFTVLGSNDDSNWTVLKTVTGASGMAQVSSFEIENSTIHEYIAIVATRAYSSAAVAMGQIELLGIPAYDPDAHGTDVIMRSVPNVPNTDWLEVYYDAKNYSGSGDVQDETTNNRDGVIHGNTSLSSADGIHKFDFDGSGDYIESLNITSISGNQPLSTSVWVKFTSWNNSTYDFVHSLGDRSISGTGKEYALAVNHANTNTGLYISSDGASNIQSRLIPDLGRWYHFTTTYDGKNFHMFIDGINHTSGTAGSASMDFPTSGCDLVLGADTASSRGQFMNGSIANFRLFNRALSADEVWQLYAYQKEYFDVSPDVVTFKGGRLGIGTSEPRAVLDVRGAVNAETFYGLNDATVAYKFFDTDTTLYTFSGLNLRVGEAYKIIWSYHNTTPNHNVHMFVNGDETDTNYWHAIHQVTSTFASAGSTGNSARMFSTGSNSDHIWVYDLRLSHDGRPMMMGHGHFSTPTSGMSTSANQSWRLGTWYHKVKTNAITSLKFDPTSTGAFGAGSYVRILKMM
jgi:hypothetical protein